MKTRSEIALASLDDVARRQELKWGIDRLPKLVPADMAAAYWRQVAKLNAAIEDEATGGSIANVEYEAGRMVNAWTALDAAAEAAGAAPLSPRTLEARMEDGRLLVVCDGLEAAHRIAGDDRAAVVWTMEEIARVLFKFELTNACKTIWPGATVEAVRVDPERAKPPVDWSRGDDLPSTLLAG